MNRKNIANIISIIRIVLSLMLLFIAFNSILFICIYVLCGLSDVLDGYLARRLNIQSTFGAKLDSFADLIMFIVILFIMIPYLQLPMMSIIWILLIALVKLISCFINFFKFRSFSLLHTYANKITGFLLFLLPIMITSVSIHYLATVICIIATYASIEELIISVTAIDLELNKKSYFIKH